MTVTAITPATNAGQTQAPARSGGLGSLGQGDFLKIMTVQIQQQDPFDPVDQKEMLAQMAQFSSLAGVAEMGETLKTIAGKLDALASAQAAFMERASSAAATPAPAPAPAIEQE